MIQLPHTAPTPIIPGQEWMITNGLGGYASGTLSFDVSRRHDGVLVAALPYPRGRSVLVDRLDEYLLINGQRHAISDFPAQFQLVAGLPHWTYETPLGPVCRRVVMPWRQNSTQILYDLPTGGDLRIEPWLHCRHADWDVNQPVGEVQDWDADGHVCLQMGDWPLIRLGVSDGHWDRFPLRQQIQTYPIETEREFLDHGPILSWIGCTLPGGGCRTLILSSESWMVASAVQGPSCWQAELTRKHRLLSACHPSFHHGMAATLALAADAFIFEPQNRPAFAAQAAAEGDLVRSLIAGYPWFNDWGRDTMISLEGLTLLTGRAWEAQAILRTFARCLKDGLIPDNIPDGPWPPVYHTADATLWFFHALDRYLHSSQDWALIDQLLPAMMQSLHNHRNGTLFGIGCDPADGLLRAAAPGYQLTWMDAIVGDWVVTPRRGKPVEINALWYNALCVTAGWLRRAGQTGPAQQIQDWAQQVRQSFNDRFWNETNRCLYDVVDGEPAEAQQCRPNQIFAISLPHAVLDQCRWSDVFETVSRDLRTPYGIRSLSVHDPAYRPCFAGGQLSRDGAYHQGTVWPWLVGAYIDMWLRVKPDQHREAQEYLLAMRPLLTQYCQGTFGEVADGNPPHGLKGCTAQAWSVAEWLRAWAKTNPF